MKHLLLIATSQTELEQLKQIILRKLFAFLTSQIFGAYFLVKGVS